MNVEEYIRQDWPESSAVSRICFRLWEGLRKQGLSADHYTFNELKDLAAAREERDLAQALLYLSNSNLRVLKPSFLYETERGDIFELPSVEADRFVLGQTVIHPDSGMPLDPSEVLVAFVPGDQLLADLRPEALRRRGGGA